MEILYIVSKIIFSLGLLLLAVLLLALVLRSKSIIKGLQLIDGAVHGASAAILTQGSIIAMLLPLFLQNKSKSGIWHTIFKLSPLAKDKRIKKFLAPVANITESIVDLIKSK